MPRKRLPENAGLPTRWKLAHGAFYYQVPAGMEYAWDGKKLFPLGRKLSDAYKKWAERIGGVEDVRTISQLLDRYILEVTPQKAISSQKREREIIKLLRSVFGNMPLMAIQPTHIYRYADKRGKKSAKGGGLATARREIAVLSHAYSKAVRWGYIDRHPFKGQVTLETTAPRTRYIEDWEIIECLSLPSLRKKGSVIAIQAYIKLKLLTGLRGGDILRLKVADLKEDGLHVLTQKTKRAVVYSWTDVLRDVLQEAMAARPVHISPYVFCNKKGASYYNEKTGSVTSWDSMWQRFMDRVLIETKVKERFTAHDLRAKAASDADNLEHARSLLTHVDSKITQRIYRRKPEVVRPIR
jgi:integrase